MKEFYSYCGGLPAPEYSDNPLRFKFSWSPRGALLSQRNSAQFLLNGKEVTIAAEDLMATAKPYFVADGYSFYAFPNRNSVPFREFYNIPEAETVIRGSLRYEGNPAFVAALANIGWLDTDEKEWLREGLTWSEVHKNITGAANTDERQVFCVIVYFTNPFSVNVSTIIERIKEKCQFPNETECARIISGLRWMGILGSELATVRGKSLLDTLCAQLEKLMSFQSGERDLVMLQHKFVVEWSDDKKV